MTRIEEVYASVLPEMEANGVEDTLENRHSFLTGLRDGWVEDTSDNCIEKSLYVLAVTCELVLLHAKIITQK